MASVKHIKIDDLPIYWALDDKASKILFADFSLKPSSRTEYANLAPFTQFDLSNDAAVNEAKSYSIDCLKNHKLNLKLSSFYFQKSGGASEDLRTFTQTIKLSNNIDSTITTTMKYIGGTYGYQYNLNKNNISSTKTSSATCNLCINRNNTYTLDQDSIEYEFYDTLTVYDYIEGNDVTLTNVALITTFNIGSNENITTISVPDIVTYDNTSYTVVGFAEYFYRNTRDISCDSITELHFPPTLQFYYYDTRYDVGPLAAFENLTILEIPMITEITGSNMWDGTWLPFLSALGVNAGATISCLILNNFLKCPIQPTTGWTYDWHSFHNTKKEWDGDAGNNKEVTYYMLSGYPLKKSELSELYDDTEINGSLLYTLRKEVLYRNFPRLWSDDQTVNYLIINTRAIGLVPENTTIREPNIDQTDGTDYYPQKKSRLCIFQHLFTESNDACIANFSGSIAFTTHPAYIYESDFLRQEDYENGYNILLANFVTPVPRHCEYFDYDIDKQARAKEHNKIFANLDMAYNSCYKYSHYQNDKTEPCYHFVYSHTGFLPYFGGTVPSDEEFEQHIADDGYPWLTTAEFTQETNYELSGLYLSLYHKFQGTSYQNYTVKLKPQLRTKSFWAERRPQSTISWGSYTVSEYLSKSLSISASGWQYKVGHDGTKSADAL